MLKIERTWVPIVFGDRPSWLATARLVKPELTSSATLRSAAVSVSQATAGFGVPGAGPGTGFPARRSSCSTACRGPAAPIWPNISRAWSSSRTPAARDPGPGPASRAVP